MEKKIVADDGSYNPNVFQDGYHYCLDTVQRSILFADTLRKRGNTYLEHLKAGHPPVLVFAYETILDARNFERPANYALARIINRRKNETNVQKRKYERRARITLAEEIKDVETRKPLVIIDPRAGHGPGIGGSKENSEIGLALAFGHEVYFIYFFTEPMPGQTLADVKNAEVRFLEEVKKRHPKAPRPAVIGNCQGGWAAALLGADRPDLVGPLVMNGAPLAYWSGVDGKNPMRYAGGLLGGAWMNSLLNDLGNGQFDGANLVINMENLNPANTLWTKLYRVYSKIDTEEKRFLEFEKWWGGFVKLSAHEIHQIVADLFIGNKLSQGIFELEENKKINLKQFNDPVVVFASEGDNITPPQQALNWIPMTYDSVDEIKQCQQIIVYMVHPTIGHLGIFVSTSIAKKEQQEIIGSIDMINYLSPGLYEMVILQEPSKPWMNDYHVRFEERDMEDILAYDDGVGNEKAFPRVAAISEYNDALYQALVSPWVKMMINEPLAEFMRQLHPLRTQRYLFSDLNPFLKCFKNIAPLVKENRQPARADNFFLKMEQIFSKTIEDSLDFYRDIRDLSHENIFKTIYGNPILDVMFPASKDLPGKGKQEEKSRETAYQEDRKHWLDAMKKGGDVEGIVRIIIAVGIADKTYDEDEIKTAAAITRSHALFQNLTKADLREIVKDQSRILQIDQEKALALLPNLLKTKTKRAEAYEIAEKIAGSDASISPEEKGMLEKIKKILKL